MNLDAYGYTFGVGKDDQDGSEWSNEKKNMLWPQLTVLVVALSCI